MREYAGKRDLDTPTGDIELDVYSNPELTEIASYLVKYSTAMAGIRRGKSLPKGARLNFLETKLPTAMRVKGGTVMDAVTKHRGREDYDVYIDYRLENYERIAKVAHEIGHLLGGHKTDERMAHILAIDQLYKILRTYDDFSRPEVQEKLKERTGVNIDPRYMPREEIGKALKYLVDTKDIFGVTDKDLKEMGVLYNGNSGLEGRIGMFLGGIGILSFLISSPVISGRVIGGVGLENMNYFGTFFILASIFLMFIGYKRNYKKEVKIEKMKI